MIAGEDAELHPLLLLQGTSCQSIPCIYTCYLTRGSLSPENMGTCFFFSWHTAIIRIFLVPLKRKTLNS